MVSIGYWKAIPIVRVNRFRQTLIGGVNKTNYDVDKCILCVTPSCKAPKMALQQLRYDYDYVGIHGSRVRLRVLMLGLAPPG